MYDLLYRFGAPWEGDPRSELVGLVESGRLNPSSMPRAIDLGCGSGANSVFLAEHGFDVTGVDFSPVALRKAAALAAEHGVSPTFVQGDLTATSIHGVDGRFNLLVDYGTLDDLKGARRDAMAATITRLAGLAPHFCCGASALSLQSCRSSASTDHLAYPAPSLKKRSPGCSQQVFISSGFPSLAEIPISDASYSQSKTSPGLV